MTKFYQLSILLFLFCFTSALFSQDEKSDNDTTGTDDGQMEEVIDWAWQGKFYPFVEATAGLAQLKHQKFEGVLPENGLAEIKLGYAQIQEYESIVL